MRKQKRGSIQIRVAVGIVAIAIALMIVCVSASFRTYIQTMDEHYKQQVTNIGRTVAQIIDGDQIKVYVDTLQKDEHYDQILSQLYTLKETNQCKYLYIEYVDLKQDCAVYIMDADTVENAYKLGDQTERTRELKSKTMDNSYKKKGIEPTINRSEFGWLCSGFQPITDSNGHYVALVGVDISMDDVMKDHYQFLALLIALMVVVVFFCIIITIKVVDKFVLHPLKMLTVATEAFISDKYDDSSELTRISMLDIHTNDEIETLASSVKQMEQDINHYIENLKHVMTEKERISAELNVARNIQASMLPCIFPPFPERDEFDIYALMNPAKEVGGDFYDFFLIDNTHLAVVIADVSGKGVPAALFMVITKSLIKNYTLMKLPLDEVFEKVNSQLCENNDAGMFVTAFMGILDLETDLLQYVNAGHNRPLIQRNEGDFEWLSMHRGFVLAGLENTVYKKEEIQLSKQDVLFIYTDGVTEAMNIDRQLYSDERLHSIINQTKNMKMIDMLSYLKKDVNLFTDGAEQADDITMLGIRINHPINQN
ncbi:MAG: PP2C family protein-serine/threonine phosphatase [Clostridia bacterium]|nr:PP2C family protein-serine/threonine phosphatase [Clostridia bacterium]